MNAMTLLARKLTECKLHHMLILNPVFTSSVSSIASNIDEGPLSQMPEESEDVFGNREFTMLECVYA